MPFLLFLLSVATLVAVSSKSKASPSAGRSQTFTLDANMPDSLRNQVLAALVSGSDPATLDAFATAIRSQYPLSAGLLHAKATSLRAGIPAGPPAPSLPVVATNDPGGPPLDGAMSPALVAFVHAELANETDPNKLLTLANTLGAQYPIAAELLTQRAAVLNVQPSPYPAPSPSPAPTNPSGPALNMPGLDPGMPPDVAQAVMGELIGDSDTARLQAYAAQIQGQYPMAASLLSSKASTILALQQPSPSPQPIPVIGPTFPSGPVMGMDAGMPPETVQLVLNELANEGDPTKLQALADQLAPKYPIAAGLLRSRANVILVTRPPSEIVPPFPSDPTNSYVVQQGDFPWKIATKLTGHGARWPELIAANPTKPRAADGNFATLLPGEKLSVPAAWAGAPPVTPSAPPTTVATIDLSAVPIIAPQPSPPSADGAALDPNMPPDVATAVRNALQTATDANQVRGFASSIAPHYPRSAELLNSKANALTAFGPTKAVVLSSAPLAASNAPAATYKVKPGDSPSKIAASLVHDGNRWKELVAANPQKKRAANGNFANLVPGEVLHLPASWAPARPTTAQGGA